MLKVLLCASEVAPVIKIGGLGDVVGSLPKALEAVGVDADVVVPFFPTAKIENFHMYKSRTLRVMYDAMSHEVEVWATKLPASNVDLYLLKNDLFFGTGGKEAFLNTPNETQIFAFFDKCVCELVKSRFNTYDVVHCNDWHTGLVPHLLSDELGASRPASIMTIHNISYQGTGAPSVITDVGLTATAHKSLEWDISDGDLNLLMQGIMSADFINTVSPSYADELIAQTDSSQISQVLTARKDRFLGILNGLDYRAFPREFSVTDWQQKKQIIKTELEDELGMFGDKDRPIFSMISRLDPNQKGLDILSEVVPDIVGLGGDFVLLGSGDKTWEAKFTELADKLNRKHGRKAVSVSLLFDAGLANRIYQGSDFFLIPSKFEPCGLTQMIAMWYGAVPVARAVGGLKDTIKQGRTGFLFEDYSGQALLASIQKCFNIYKSPAHSAIVEECLKQDFSFDKSAKLYKELYEKAVQIRKDAYGTVHF